jgi:hypothetical protein
MSETQYRYNGQCEYCDTQTLVNHFPHLALNACDDCYRVHKDAIDAAERKAGGK